jgi:hypothetical protein
MGAVHQQVQHRGSGIAPEEPPDQREVPAVAHDSMITKVLWAYDISSEGGPVSEQRPRVDGRDPGEAIEEMVEHVLGLAETWLVWDGKPVSGLGREYTPHKAIRRVADHMIDHLAQLDARIAGVSSLPDEWHASAITTEADMARFSREDLDEARSRLRRLAQVWRIRLRSVPRNELDAPKGDDYTLREIAFCAVESGDYADAIGPLGP